MAAPYHPARRPAVDPAWRAQRLAEARTVVANVARHSDHLVRLACQMLTTHGQSERERRDDVIVIGAESHIIQGEPLRDRERLIWTLDLRRA